MDDVKFAVVRVQGEQRMIDLVTLLVNNGYCDVSFVTSLANTILKTETEAQDNSSPSHAISSSSTAAAAGSSDLTTSAAPQQPQLQPSSTDSVQLQPTLQVQSTAMREEPTTPIEPANEVDQLLQNLLDGNAEESASTFTEISLSSPTKKAQARFPSVTTVPSSPSIHEETETAVPPPASATGSYPPPANVAGPPSASVYGAPPPPASAFGAPPPASFGGASVPPPPIGGLLSYQQPPQQQYSGMAPPPPPSSLGAYGVPSMMQVGGMALLPPPSMGMMPPPPSMPSMAPPPPSMGMPPPPPLSRPAMGMLVPPPLSIFSAPPSSSMGMFAPPPPMGLMAPPPSSMAPPPFMAPVSTSPAMQQLPSVAPAANDAACSSSPFTREFPAPFSNGMPPMPAKKVEAAGPPSVMQMSWNPFVPGAPPMGAYGAPLAPLSASGAPSLPPPASTIGGASQAAAAPKLELLPADVALMGRLEQLGAAIVANNPAGSHKADELMTRLRVELTPRLAGAKLSPPTRAILEQAVDACYAGEMLAAAAATNNLVQTGADFVEVSAFHPALESLFTLYGQSFA